MADLDPRDIEDLSRAIKELVRVLGDSGDSFSRMRREVDETSDEISGLGDSAEDSVKSARAERDARDANSQIIKQDNEIRRKNADVLRDSERTLKSFVRALESGEASFSKYNDTLSNASNIITTFTANMGILGKSVGFLAQGALKLGELQLKQADDTLKATDQLAKMGSAGQMTAEEVRQLGIKAGYTSSTLDKLIKPIASMSDSIIGIGSTAARGQKAFAEIAAVGPEIRKQFRALGVSQEELTQSQADYIKLQVTTGNRINKPIDELRKSSLEYTENLLTLAALTGKDIEQIKKEQELATGEIETMIQNNLMDQEIARLKKTEGEEAKIRLDQLVKEKEARNKLLERVQSEIGDPALRKGLAQFLATGAVTEQSAFLLQMGVPIQEFAERIKKGEDVSNEFMDALKQAGDATIKQVGYSAMFDEELRKKFGITEEFLRFLSKNRDMTEEERVKAIEEEKERIKREGDTAQDARNLMLETELALAQGFDNLLAETNFLLKGFNETTTAVAALQVAAIGAAVALGARGILGTAGSVLGTAGTAMGLGVVGTALAAGAVAAGVTYAGVKGVEYLANKNLDEKVQKQDKQTTEDTNADYNKGLSGTGYTYDLSKGGLLDKEGKYVPTAQAPEEIQAILGKVYEERRKKQTAPKMAIGGLLGTNQTAIVGEAGPEFITGPARVTGVNQTQKMIADAMRQVGLGSPFTSSAIRTQTILMERSLNEIGEEKEKELEHLTESNLSLEQMSDNTEKVSNIFKKFEEQLKTLFGVTDEQSLFDQEEERERQRQQNSQNRTGGAPTSAATIKNALNSERGKKALEYFMSQGWTEAQAAGIVGNLMVESGADLQHQAVGDQGQAYGIAQWHPDRQQEFEKAFGKNIRESTFEEQLEFVQHELENKEAKAARMLASVDDPVQAAVLFDEFYERSAGLHTAKRADIAYALATETTDQITTKDQVATTTSTQTAKPVVPDTTAQNVELMAMNARVMTELSDKLSILISKQEENNEILTRVKNNTG